MPQPSVAESVLLSAPQSVQTASPLTSWSTETDIVNVHEEWSDPIWGHWGSAITPVQCVAYPESLKFNRFSKIGSIWRTESYFLTEARSVLFLIRVFLIRCWLPASSHEMQVGLFLGGPFSQTQLPVLSQIIKIFLRFFAVNLLQENLILLRKENRKAKNS